MITTTELIVYAECKISMFSPEVWHPHSYLQGIKIRFSTFFMIVGAGMSCCDEEMVGCLVVMKQ